MDVGVLVPIDTAFVARFIGGHDVVPSRTGSVAVRADRCRLGSAGPEPGVSGRATAVEYLGAAVRVTVRASAAAGVRASGPFLRSNSGFQKRPPAT